MNLCDFLGWFGVPGNEENEADCREGKAGHVQGVMITFCFSMCGAKGDMVVPGIWMYDMLLVVPNSRSAFQAGRRLLDTCSRRCAEKGELFRSDIIPGV